MATTNFIWDVANDSYLMETDGSGSTVATYTGEPRPFGHLISQYRNGLTNSYHFDSQRSTRQLTDAIQNVTDSYTYAGFGEEIAKSGTSRRPFGYQGCFAYYSDSGTPDIYVRARMYGRQLGRWLSVDPDPIGFGSPYVASVNDPINLTDPSGMCICCCCAVSLGFNDVHRTFTAQTFGHSFTVDLVLGWKPSQHFEDCSFRWEEMTDQLAPIHERMGCKVNEWCDLTNSGAPNLDDWVNRKPSCELEFIALPDNPRIRHVEIIEPAFPFPRRRLPTWYRNLCIRVTLRSAPTCDCPQPREMTIIALQQLQVVGWTQVRRTSPRPGGGEYRYWEFVWDPTIVIHDFRFTSEETCRAVMGKLPDPSKRHPSIPWPEVP